MTRRYNINRKVLFKYFVKKFASRIFLKISLQKSKSVLVETLKYLFFMSPHTFPAICYGIAKNICDLLSVSRYNKLLEMRMQLRKQFEVDSIHIFKYLSKITIFLFILKYFVYSKIFIDINSHTRVLIRKRCFRKYVILSINKHHSIEDSI